MYVHDPDQVDQMRDGGPLNVVAEILDPQQGYSLNGDEVKTAVEKPREDTAGVDLISFDPLLPW